MTLADYIRDSLRLAKILGENDVVQPEMGENGQRVYNDLIEDLRGDGIEIGLYPFSNTAATLEIPGDYRLSFKYLFAAHLCASYGREPTMFVSSMAERAYEKLSRKGVLASNINNDAPAPLGEGSSPIDSFYR